MGGWVGWGGVGRGGVKCNSRRVQNDLHHSHPPFPSHTAVKRLCLKTKPPSVYERHTWQNQSAIMTSNVKTCAHSCTPRSKVNDSSAFWITRKQELTTVLHSGEPECKRTVLHSRHPGGQSWTGPGRGLHGACRQPTPEPPRTANRDPRQNLLRFLINLVRIQHILGPSYPGG